MPPTNQQTNILADSYVFKGLSMGAVTEIMQVPQTIAIENHSEAGDIAYMRCWISTGVCKHGFLLLSFLSARLGQGDHPSFMQV